MLQVRCDSCDNKVIEPLVEIYQDDNSLEIQCPICSVSVFPCENCFHLLKLENDQFLYCTICGFMNIKSEKIRKKLQYPKFSMSFKQVRVIQRILNEKKYLENKMKEYKQDSNGDKLFLKTHIESLIEPELIREDYEEIEKILSFQNNLNLFTKIHLKMLQALYDKQENKPEIIKKVANFFEKSDGIIQLKKNFHMNELASKCDFHDKLSLIFKNQSKQKKIEWEDLTTKFLSLLVEINEHVEILIKELMKQKDENLFFKVDEINEKQFHDESLKDKIKLWRNAFKSISTLIE
eukprot:gene4073-7362_t